MVTQAAFVFLVFAVAVQRGLELYVSRRNEARLLARGGREHAREQVPYMVALHTGFLVCTLLESLLMAKPMPWALSLSALLVFCIGQALRLSAIWALGSRWTVKVITVPGEEVVTRGVFRYLRHPNYLGVALEILALPLVHGAWITALVFSVLNAVFLHYRIRAEERALNSASDYLVRFEHRPRLLPGMHRS